jgi:hypothetical protein
MGYTKGARLTLPRVPRVTLLPFDIIEGRLDRLNAPRGLVAEMRAEWGALANEDRGWLADEMGKSTDDELIAGFAKWRAEQAPKKRKPRAG